MFNQAFIPSILSNPLMQMNLNLRLMLLSILISACTPSLLKQKNGDVRLSNGSIKGKALQAQEKLRANLFQSIDSEGMPTDINDQKGLFRQGVAFFGREDLGEKFSMPSEVVPCKASQKNPIEVIKELAKRTSVVIVNEDHASPQHRYFVEKVLEALRPEGYAIYAVETLSRNLVSGNKNVWATDGYFINEPIFGRVIRRAKALGYELVAYEQTAEQAAGVPADATPLEQVNAREEFQASNLMNKIFANYRGSKTIVHVGHSHVNERTQVGASGQISWMAKRLKDASGIDPVTISQTACVSGGSEIIAATDTLGSVEPKTFQAVDLYVGHPPLEFSQHRPKWRRDIGDIYVSIPERLLSKTNSVIVEARILGSDRGAVPQDRVLLLPGEAIPLLLPKGRYRLDAFTKTGKLNSQSIIVDVESVVSEKP